MPVVKFKEENGDEYFFDGYTGLGKDSTTARSWLYNLFDWNTPETNSLKEQFKSKLDEYNTLLSNPIPKVYYSQCWYNVLRTGQKINPLSPLPCQPGTRTIVAQTNTSVFFNGKLPAVTGDKTQMLFGSPRILTGPYKAVNIIIGQNL